ncbi:MAG: hypothetical protein P8N72_08925 [Flavimaricola sp.]|nr:hypothetical protein [Flavimaricola sp.]
MRQPSREDYERAVALARAAIRAEKDASHIRADRSPQAVLAKIQVKQAKGEAPTQDDIAALAGALAEHEKRGQRGRGRPKGARDYAAHGAVRAAIWAVQDSGLRPYRNDIGPRTSQCDSIAEAMKAEGFRTLCSYDSAKRKMMAFRRGVKDHRGRSTGIARHLQAIAHNISKALEPLASQMQESGRAIGEAFGPMAREMQENGQAFAALGGQLRAQTTLPPETRRAIEKHLKTKL